MQNNAITIGNFDGCHLGHQALIRQTIQHQTSSSISATLAMSFDPHPDDFFNPNHKTAKLFTIDQKIRALKELGIHDIRILPFNDQVRLLSAKEFYQQYLRDDYGAKAITVGKGFRFGKNRQGDAQVLERLCSKDNIALSLLPEVEVAGEVVSSTRIRNLLARDGAVESAARLLGRPYMLQGHVSRGEQLGRTIGFPTANLSGYQQLIPLRGVYAVMADLSQKDHISIFADTSKLVPAMMNIGYRPTLKNAENSLSVEVHLLGKQGESIGENQLYGKRLSLYFVRRVRDETKFESLDELKKQLMLDRANIEDILKRSI